MKLFICLIALTLLLPFTPQARASALRNQVMDTIQPSSLSTSFTLPGSSDQLAGKTVPNYGTGATTFTTNGMIFGNGTSPLGVTAAGSQYGIFQAGASGIPTVGSINLASSAAVGSTILGVPNGGTGLATVTSNGIPYGQGTSAEAVTAAGTQYQVFQAGSGGTPAFGAVNLAQSAAVTGILASANGGTGVASPTSGGVLVGAGSSPVTAVTCSNTGYILSWGGSSWSCVAPPSSAPALNGGSGSPDAVLAATGVSLAGISYQNIIWIDGGNGASAVTVTATPSVTAGTSDGQTLTILGASSITTNTVTLQDASNLSGSGLSMNGNIVVAANSAISFVWNALTSTWVETSRR